MRLASRIGRSSAAGVAVAAIVCAALSAKGGTRAYAAKVDATLHPSSVGADTIGPSIRDSILWMEMRNVWLHVDDDHYMRVRSLRGAVTPTVRGATVTLDDLGSFRINVTSGTVSLTGPDLAALLNDWVFKYPGAPLRDLKGKFENGSLVLSGTMHKGVDMPFEITSTVSLEPDGLIKSHPTRTRILGVNGEALLHALGLHLDKVLDLRGSRGASVKGDDIYLDPNRIVPPPAICGRLASVAVVGDEIVQTFVTLPADQVFSQGATAASPAERVDSAPGGFVSFRGGRLRFGKLTMNGTDLLIIDADPRNPFDLYLARYNRQLVAGTSVTTPQLGLRVTMPDYARVSPVAAR